MKAKTKLVVCNALFVGLISLLGSLPVSFPTSLQAALPNLYAGAIGFSLAFLSQIRTFLEKEISDEEKAKVNAMKEHHKKKKSPPKLMFGIVIPVCW